MCCMTDSLPRILDNSVLLPEPVSETLIRRGCRPNRREHALPMIPTTTRGRYIGSNTSSETGILSAVDSGSDALIRKYEPTVAPDKLREPHLLTSSNMCCLRA